MTETAKRALVEKITQEIKVSSMNHLYTPNNTPTFAIHVENAVFPIEIE
ncbi:MAG: hypothetical protein LBH96_02910 [Candidatus Peribacteria bacterium]|nr:hypothetical protein [Candidatus Peribacteria bacterium]